MDAIQFSLFFAAIVIAYVLVHVRLVRFEKYLKEVSVLQVLNDRLKTLADGLQNIRVDRLEEQLQQLHEDLEAIHEVEKKIVRGQTAAREAGPAAAAERSAASAAEKIRSVVEERLLHLDYHNLRILTDLKNVNLDDELEVLVECERNDMPYKGHVRTRNGNVSDVEIHSVAQSFP